MFFYKANGKLMLSNGEYNDLLKVTENEIITAKDIVYYLVDRDPSVSRRSYSLTDTSLLTNNLEDINLLLKASSVSNRFPSWFKEKVDARLIKVINTSYPNWLDSLIEAPLGKWRVNVIGLGDVGGTLVTGLRLLGSDCISSIGIFDLDRDKVRRWELESSQILDATRMDDFPTINILKEDELFNCDMFVFCVSLGVPPVGIELKDVRMAQLEGNSKIISLYAKKARELKFKGIFSVVSDPVDLLCKAAFSSSNTDSIGQLDYMGLAPEQIRGYGLGVMNARAAYYAKLCGALQYIEEGRVFGPHGEGLIVADSIYNYNHKLSMELTANVINANLEVRKTRYKPYIAPAFSSGSISLINTIRGEWHYSSNFIGGIYMGARNRLLKSGIELERNELDRQLVARLKETYERLAK